MFKVVSVWFYRYVKISRFGKITLCNLKQQSLPKSVGSVVCTQICRQGLLGPGTRWLLVQINDDDLCDLLGSVLWRWIVRQDWMESRATFEKRGFSGPPFSLLIGALFGIVWDFYRTNFWECGKGHFHFIKCKHNLFGEINLQNREVLYLISEVHICFPFFRGGFCFGQQ